MHVLGKRVAFAIVTYRNVAGLELEEHFRKRKVLFHSIQLFFEKMSDIANISVIIKRPRGRAPNGLNGRPKKWNSESGVWYEDIDGEDGATIVIPAWMNTDKIRSYNIQQDCFRTIGDAIDMAKALHTEPDKVEDVGYMQMQLLRLQERLAFANHSAANLNAGPSLDVGASYNANASSVSLSDPGFSSTSTGIGIKKRKKKKIQHVQQGEE